MIKPGNANILVVDDAEEIRSIVEVLLEEAGYTTSEAVDGMDALEVVAKSPPDLILLDIDMPRMDGFECCQRLKDDPVTRDIPVIFLTSKNATEAVSQGFELGAVDYIIKPFSGRELLARVKTHVQLTRALHRLDQLAGDLSKYLSDEVYASIFKGETDVKIEAQQKPLTICFTDIVDFTPQVEARQPAELTEWLNNYFNEMAKIVTRYGGTLDKYIGDAILVFHGSPNTLGLREDAIQCLRMAQDMMTSAKQLGIQIRIGISSGDCTVGNFGSDQHMDYTIIGKEANVAARLQTTCEPEHILISESTYQLIKDDIPCTANAEIQVKGLQRIVMTYWADS